MKKRNLVLGVLVTLCMLVSPVITNAAAGTIFGASDEAMTTTTESGSVAIANNGDNTKIYLGVDVTSGTFTAYNATLTLKNSNFSFNKITPATGWTGSAKENADGTISISLTNTTGVTTGKHLVATVSLSVASATATTETCTIGLSPVTTTTTPKCTVSNGKYYDNNGNEVTEAAYTAACTTTENPQTGSFLPYVVIIAGVAVAVGLAIATKKNKMYRL